MQHHIIITGGIASGKTTLVANFAASLRDKYRITGVVATTPERPHFSGEPAQIYELTEIPTGIVRPWAAPSQDGEGFRFHADTQAYLDHELAPGLAANPPDILFLDEIGNLELKGRGLDKLLKAASASPIPLIICTVKKRLLDPILANYHLQPRFFLDLDNADSNTPGKVGIITDFIHNTLHG